MDINSNTRVAIETAGVMTFFVAAYILVRTFIRKR